jgi:hypothetical protein
MRLSDVGVKPLSDDLSLSHKNATHARIGRREALLREAQGAAHPNNLLRRELRRVHEEESEGGGEERTRPDSASSATC